MVFVPTMLVHGVLCVLVLFAVYVPCIVHEINHIIIIIIIIIEGFLSRKSGAFFALKQQNNTKYNP